MNSKTPGIYVSPADIGNIQNSEYQIEILKQLRSVLSFAQQVNLIEESRHIEKCIYEIERIRCNFRFTPLQPYDPKCFVSYVNNKPIISPPIYPNYPKYPKIQIHK